MSTTFTRLPITASNSQLPVVSRADVDYFTNYDPTTYEHWILGGNSACLTGPVNGNALTPQASVAYATNSIQLSSPIGSGLLTPLEESASLVRTLCCVFKFSVTSGTYGVMGSLGTAADINGGGVFIGGTSPSQLLYSTYRGVTSSVAIGNVTAGNWYFVAVSADFSGATKKLNHLVGGQTGVASTSSSAYIAPTAGRKTALGCAYGPTPAVTVSPMSFAEFMVFDGQALSMAELQAMYASRKAKLAMQGIDVV